MSLMDFNLTNSVNSAAIGLLSGSSGDASAGGKSPQQSNCSDPYVCQSNPTKPQKPSPTQCQNGGSPSVNNNPNLPQNEQVGTLVGVIAGIVGGVVLAFVAPELEPLDALHLAPYAGMTLGGAGGAAGFGVGAASTTATCP